MADGNIVNGDEEIVGPDKKKLKTSGKIEYALFCRRILFLNDHFGHHLCKSSLVVS